MNVLTPREFMHADQESIAEDYIQAGRVVSTTGSQIIVLLDKGLRGRGGLQMGGLVRVQSGHVVVYGIVEGLCTPMPMQERNGDELHLAEIGLLGEICDANLPILNGAVPGRFRRGVSHVPALESIVCVASEADIKNVYAIPGRREVIVGTLNNAPQVAARISVDDMLGKHFALLGTTGTGKSCALTLMIKRIFEQSQNGHVLLLDPHGEYGQAFANQAAHLTVDSFRLPYWLADFEELTEIVFGHEKRERVSEIMLLREMVLEAKLSYAQPADRAWITVDSPVPYNLGILNRHIDNAMGGLDNKGNIEPFQRIKARLTVLQNDKRYAFMFNIGLGAHDNLAEILGELFRVPANGKPLAILDLARLPSEVLNVVVAVICRIAFDFAMCVGQTVPLLLICEEAHRYAPQDSALGFEPAKRALSRIAKEGRKYGISLGIVSQRPSELAATILSQCNTVFAFRMANARDQEIIQATLPEASPAMFSALPFLGNMEAIAIGEGVPVPMRLQFESLPESERPRSGSASFSEQWQRTEEVDGAQMQRVVDSMRSRKSAS
jgi:uncharacterized protein